MDVEDDDSRKKNGWQSRDALANSHRDLSIVEGIGKERARSQIRSRDIGVPGAALVEERGKARRKERKRVKHVRIRVRERRRKRRKKRMRRMRWRDSGKDEEGGRWKTRAGYEMAGPQRGQRSRMTTRRLSK